MPAMVGGWTSSADGVVSTSGASGAATLQILRECDALSIWQSAILNDMLHHQPQNFVGNARLISAYLVCTESRLPAWQVIRR